MKILYFGTYSIGPGYPRNCVIIKGLRASGARVEECHVTLWRDPKNKNRLVSKLPTFVFFLPSLTLAWIRLTFRFLQMNRDYDVMIVGYTGHLDIFLARLLNGRRPLVFDAFLSLREALVEDRGLFRAGGLWDRVLKWLDRRAALLADRVLLDTDEHIVYYARSACLSRSKFIRVFVGVDEDIFTPRKDPPLEPPMLLYFGTYLRLHGVDTIIRAAKLLEDKNVVIELIGNGPEYPKVRRLADELGLRNVRFETKWLDSYNIADRVGVASICLGIFGTGEKARRVIPCKVFPALAMAKPLITGETPAATEALRHGDNAYLVPLNNPQALARAIQVLLDDNQLAANIGLGGAKTFQERFTPAAIGRELMAELEKIVVEKRK
ncbi:MAG: glycosyltransferase [Deltaproteobacteria bacterium]|nr:glycosyltransferase [Deltaproteobacteria bacterium]MBW2106160.1 glycosyltransferase [Deltaproteobacteria bacterium]